MSLCVDAAVAAFSDGVSSAVPGDDCAAASKAALPVALSAADLPGATVLGAGGQRLTGSAGDDLIYADRRPGDSDGQLVLRAAAGAEGLVGMTAPGGAAFVAAGDALSVYGTDSSLGLGGAAGWSVGAGGALSAFWTQSSYYYDEPVLTGADAILSITHQGASWLVTGGWGVSLSRLGRTGAPELMDTVWARGSDGLSRPGAFAGWSDGDALHVLVGGGTEGGLSSYVWDGDALALEVRVADDRDTRLNDVAAIETLAFGATRYALTLTNGDGGLTVWRVDADGAGSLEEVDRRSPEDAETGADLFRGASLTVVERIGEALVYAATERGLLVCYRLGADGALERLWDKTGVTRAEHLRIGAADYLAMTDGTGVVSLSAIGPEGALTETAALDLGDGVRTGALSVAAVDGIGVLLAARPDQGGYDLIAAEFDGDDAVYAGAGADRIHGGGGADRLFGQAGEDVIWGEDGSDLLLGGGANDQLDGGDGDDELRGGPDDDVLTGGAGADVLKGGNGRDMLDGGVGDDVLKGGMLKDQVRGGGGADLIWGGYGHDDVWGGFGDDVIYGHWGWDVVYGGVGNDWIGGGNGDDKLYGEAGDDVIKGALGKDRLWGGAGRDELHGGGFADRIWGGGGDDFLYGDDGADKLYGGDGADRLEGGRHADRLDGGGGADALIGGAGPDAFVFNRGWGRDVIFDFENGKDVIVFESGPSAFGRLTVEATDGGVLVHAGDPFVNSITLLGARIGQIGENDFDFV